MATYRGGDCALRTCPYDKSHKVSITRYAGHVANCAKSQKTAELLECPFYAGHRVRREDYELHVTQQCTYMDRDLLGRVLEKFRRDEATAGSQPTPEQTSASDPPETPTPVTYDPVTGEEYWD